MQSSPKDLSPAFTSVFRRQFDIVIYGTGFIGFSLARQLIEKKCNVLLVGENGDLLWEATRALENTTEGRDLPDAWQTWIGSISKISPTWFDPAEAEIRTAAYLQEAAPQLSTLLYAVPVAVDVSDNHIASVTVATKGGLKRIYGRHWIDASEEGIILQRLSPTGSPRKPDRTLRSIVLHSLSPEKLDALADALPQKHPGAEILPSIHETERRVRIPVTGNRSWKQSTVSLVNDLRNLLDGHGNFTVSHCAVKDFPIYHASTAPSPGSLPSNLHIASPRWRGETLATPGERFALGLKLAETIQIHPQEGPISSQSDSDPIPLPRPDRVLDGFDVVVVGTGTGGSIAAIAAARNGAKTMALDFNPYPGGVGTGSGICFYFHGLKGGLQDEIDERVKELSEVFLGHPPRGWHHEAKKVVLLDYFEENGAEFIGSALLVGVETTPNGRIEAVSIVTNGEIIRIAAKCFIDGTGDGDLCVLAGARYESGRVGDHRTLAYSQGAFTIHRKEDSLSLHCSNFDAGWTDPNNPEDITRARLTGIAQYKDIPWPDDTLLVAMTPWIGLRQSRLILTDTRVTLSDMVAHRTFPDAIGGVATIADTHSVDHEFENDEFAFYIWTCRAFRNPLSCELPYRMLLPMGLDNVWIACRAAGTEINAHYGFRMQRQMQRLGEVAGIAAAMAASLNTGSRGIDISQLQQSLRRSGALGDPQIESLEPPTNEALIEKFTSGHPGIHLWHIIQHRTLFEKVVFNRLTSPNPRTSFHAAAILAMWREPIAEDRLIQSITTLESGPSPEELSVRGPHGQCIDRPFWLQAVFFLRIIGTEKCLSALHELATKAPPLLNVKTVIALTVERLTERIGSHPLLLETLELLAAGPIEDTIQPPSFSLWHKLEGKEQPKLGNDKGAPVEENHLWQLHLILARIYRKLGRPLPGEIRRHIHDQRAIVRRGFYSLTQS